MPHRGRSQKAILFTSSMAIIHVLLSVLFSLLICNLCTTWAIYACHWAKCFWRCCRQETLVHVCREMIWSLKCMICQNYDVNRISNGRAVLPSWSARSRSVRSSHKVGKTERHACISIHLFLCVPAGMLFKLFFWSRHKPSLTREFRVPWFISQSGF